MPLDSAVLSSAERISCSHGAALRADDVVIVASVDEVVRVAASTGAEQAFIIGGTTISEQYLDRADQMIITEIPGEYDGDTLP